MKRTDYLLDELEELFDRTDQDGDRRIGFDEFKGLMLELNDARGEGSLLASFAAIDTNHDGSVSFDEMRAWWTGRHAAPA
jgi:Ca2+-binding EF-hand superfamily protein